MLSIYHERVNFNICLRPKNPWALEFMSRAKKEGGEKKEEDEERRRKRRRGEEWWWYRAQ